jgi:hypothetical protein
MNGRDKKGSAKNDLKFWKLGATTFGVHAGHRFTGTTWSDANHFRCIPTIIAGLVLPSFNFILGG